jgi:hypothetical protein
MTGRMLLGMGLLILGIVALAYQGFSCTVAEESR